MAQPSQTTFAVWHHHPYLPRRNPHHRFYRDLVRRQAALTHPQDPYNDAPDVDMEMDYSNTADNQDYARDSEDPNLLAPSRRSVRFVVADDEEEGRDLHAADWVTDTESTVSSDDGEDNEDWYTSVLAQSLFSDGIDSRPKEGNGQEEVVDEQRMAEFLRTLEKSWLTDIRLLPLDPAPANASLSALYLPPGYTLFYKPRGNQSTRKGDFHLWGHPSGKNFKSAAAFKVHLQSLMRVADADLAQTLSNGQLLTHEEDVGGSLFECPCILCGGPGNEKKPAGKGKKNAGYAGAVKEKGGAAVKKKRGPAQKNTDVTKKKNPAPGAINKLDKGKGRAVDAAFLIDSDVDTDSSLDDEYTPTGLQKVSLITHMRNRNSAAAFAAPAAPVHKLDKGNGRAMDAPIDIDPHVETDSSLDAEGETDDEYFRNVSLATHMRNHNSAAASTVTAAAEDCVNGISAGNSAGAVAGNAGSVAKNANSKGGKNKNKGKGKNKAAFATGKKKK